MNKIKENIWLVVLGAIVVSFIIPKIGLSLKPYLNYLLMILMFLSCLDIEIKQIVDSFKDYKKQIIVLAIVHLASPVLILLMRGFLSDEIFLGLILAATIPAGRSSVFLANIYGGEPTKALMVTSWSNILSPIVVPVLVWTFARTSIHMDPSEMGMAILKLVLIPIIAAILIRKTKFNKSLSKNGPNFSVIVLFLIIMGIIAPIKDIVLKQPGYSLILVAIVAGLTIINFYLGYLTGKTKPEKITYAISASYKNYTLATVLALSLFSPLVALPAIIYTIVDNILLIPMQMMMNSAKQN